MLDGVDRSEMQARRSEAVVMVVVRRKDRHDADSRDDEVGWWKAKGCQWGR